MEFMLILAVMCIVALYALPWHVDTAVPARSTTHQPARPRAAARRHRRTR